MENFRHNLALYGGHICVLLLALHLINVLPFVIVLPLQLMIVINQVLMIWKMNKSNH